MFSRTIIILYVFLSGFFLLFSVYNYLLLISINLLLNKKRKKDDVCLMTSSEEGIKLIMEKVNECVVEYGLKVNEKKSKVVCIYGEVGRRR